MLINGKEHEFENIEVRIFGVPYIPHITPPENTSLEFYYRRGSIFYFKNKLSSIRFELPISAKTYFKKGCKYDLDIKSEFNKTHDSDTVTIDMNVPKMDI